MQGISKLVLTLVVVSLQQGASLRGAEDYRTKFQAARDAHDDQRAETTLQKWKLAGSNDPEYYISAANYLLSKQSGISVSTKQAAGNDLIVADPKTGKPVGSVSASVPSPSTYQAAVALLRDGSKVAPQRADIRLGLAVLYERMDNKRALLDELSHLAAYAKAHHNRLQGRDGRPYPTPIDENLAQEINGFARRYFQSNDPRNNQLFHDLAKLDAEAFPRSVYGHNLLGIYYTNVQEKPGLALASYQRALKIVPDDSYVWMNVGLLFAAEKNKTEAASAFQKIVDLNNDPDCVRQAKGELAKLK